jgi:hypothetical protein
VIAWVVAMLVAVLGGVLAWQRWSDGSTLDHDQTATMFGIVVGIEVVAAGAGGRCRGVEAPGAS